MGIDWVNQVSAIMACLAFAMVFGATVVLFLSTPEFLVSLFAEPKAQSLIRS